MAVNGASNSIGEAMTVARELGGAQGVEIATAAQAAFVKAHGSVLILAAAMIALLSIAIFIALRGSSPEHEH
jgi:DHA2 family multidrug resistance protein-like MFS transporter